jgi:single-strand DNA-binding protein
VQGRLRQRTYQTKDGEKRTVVELEVDEIGPSLRFATANVKRATRSTSADGRPESASAAEPEPAAA